MLSDVSVLTLIFFSFSCHLNVTSVLWTSEGNYFSGSSGN